jgi:type IV secretion system protein VirB6
MSVGLFLLFPGIFALALPRVIAGVMLALGPIFVGFLLFDTTRSLFLGWVRALAWSVVAAVIVSILLNIELSVVEPQIGVLVGELTSGESGLATMGELLATSLLFALLSVGGMIAAIAPTRINVLSVKFKQISSPWIQHKPELQRSLERVALPRPQVESSPTRAQVLGDRLALVADNGRGSRQPESQGSTERRIERTTNYKPQEMVSPLGQSYRGVAGAKRAAIPVRRASTK